MYSDVPSWLLLALLLMLLLLKFMNSDVPRLFCGWSADLCSGASPVPYDTSLCNVVSLHCFEVAFSVSVALSPAVRSLTSYLQSTEERCCAKGCWLPSLLAGSKLPSSALSPPGLSAEESFGWLSVLSGDFSGPSMYCRSFRFICFSMFFSQLSLRLLFSTSLSLVEFCMLSVLNLLSSIVSLIRC